MIFQECKLKKLNKYSCGELDEEKSMTVFFTASLYFSSKKICNFLRQTQTE